MEPFFNLYRLIVEICPCAYNELVDCIKYLTQVDFVQNEFHPEILSGDSSLVSYGVVFFMLL